LPDEDELSTVVVLSLLHFLLVDNSIREAPLDTAGAIHCELVDAIMSNLPVACSPVEPEVEGELLRDTKLAVLVNKDSSSLVLGFTILGRFRVAVRIDLGTLYKLLLVISDVVIGEVLAQDSILASSALRLDDLQELKGLGPSSDGVALLHLVEVRLEVVDLPAVGLQEDRQV